MDWWHAGSLLAQTFDVMRWAWPFGAFLAAVAIGSTGVVAARQHSLPPLRWAWLLVLLLNPLLMVAVAGLWSCRNCSSTPGGGWAVRSAAGLLLAQFLIACWSTWRASTWRVCVGALHALLMWPAACTVLIISAMSRLR
jgi:hypothetical protein